MKKTIKTTLVALILFTIISPSAFAQTSLKERDARAKSIYNSAKTQYMSEVNFYKQARQDFIKAKEKFNNFKNAENKAELEEAARNFLKKAISSLEKKLASIKTWVSNNPSLSEEDKSNIIAEIEKDINWLNEKKAGVDTASPEQIREKAKDVASYWKTHRVRVKKIIGLTLSSRINYIIERANNISEQIDTKIEELRNSGLNTEDLEVLNEDFKEKIDLTEEKYELAKKKFYEIKAEPGQGYLAELQKADQLFKEGHNYLKEADSYIKSGYQKLKEIIKEMKK